MYVCGNCHRQGPSPRFQHKWGCLGKRLDAQSAVYDDGNYAGAGAGTCPQGHARHWNQAHTLAWCFICNTQTEVSHA